MRTKDRAFSFHIHTVPSKTLLYNIINNVGSSAKKSLNYILHYLRHTHIKIKQYNDNPSLLTYLCVQLYTHKKHCLSNIWFVQDLLVFCSLSLVLFLPFPTDPLQCHTPKPKRNIRKKQNIQCCGKITNTALFFQFQGLYQHVMISRKRNLKLPARKTW